MCYFDGSIPHAKISAESDAVKAANIIAQVFGVCGPELEPHCVQENKLKPRTADIAQITDMTNLKA